MLIVDIPGYGDVELRNLVLDYNGTLATDGFLIDGVREIIGELAKRVNICVISANTFGTVETELRDLPLEVVGIKPGDERRQKLELIQKLGPQATVSIGNGNNDSLMLKEARIGICVMGREGCAQSALESSDMVVSDIRSALELLVLPGRLKATLRF